MQPIPTLQELYTAQIAALEAEFEDTLPVFGKVFLRALAMVQAAKLKLFYLHLGSVQKNVFVDTADREAAGGTLERFGRAKLKRNPFTAVAGQYEVEVTGDVGAVIPSQTTFKSNDDSAAPGKLFILDSEKVLTSTTDTIIIRALEAGPTSQLSPNDFLTATSPIALVEGLVQVLSETVEPLEEEDIEDYRAKALAAYQLEPQGGAGGDYRIWTASVQGLARVYPYAKSSASAEVNLYVEAEVDDSTDGKGTPSAGMLTDVEAVVELDPDISKPIDERGRRPLGVFQVHYLAVTPLDVDIDIAGFVGLTPEIQTKILEALTEKINLIRPFISSTDVLELKNDILDTNSIIAAILNARPGSVFGTITLTVNASAVPTYTFSDGEIPWLNSVTYS